MRCNDTTRTLHGMSRAGSVYLIFVRFLAEPFLMIAGRVEIDPAPRVSTRSVIFAFLRTTVTCSHTILLELWRWSPTNGSNG